MSQRSATLLQCLQEDVRLCTDRPSLMKMAGYFFIHPGFMAVALYRFASICYPKGLAGRMAAKFLWRLNNFINACDISSHAVIGPGLHLPHPMGVVIGAATIGAHVTILQNVTVGVRQLTHPVDYPTYYPVIGDHVILGAGTVIVGALTIGDRAVIGANAVVTKNIPAGATAMGIPARVIKPVAASAA